MANRIAELRKKNGLTLEHLAELLDTSAGMVSMLEKGQRRLNQDWTEKLAVIFRCKQSELWEESPEDYKDYLQRARALAQERKDDYAVETLKILMERAE